VTFFVYINYFFVISIGHLFFKIRFTRGLVQSLFLFKPIFCSTTFSFTSMDFLLLQLLLHFSRFGSQKVWFKVFFLFRSMDCYNHNYTFILKIRFPIDSVCNTFGSKSISVHKRFGSQNDGMPYTSFYVRDEFFF
jgi:hypothetical protein